MSTGHHRKVGCLCVVYKATLNTSENPVTDSQSILNLKMFNMKIPKCK
jgi:hypothetical protein